MKHPLPLMDYFVFCGLMLGLFGNAAVFTLWLTQRRYWRALIPAVVSLVLAISILLNVKIIFFSGQLAVLQDINGCRPDAPATVPYRPGMTLCPGQSTVIEFGIPAVRDNDWGL